MPNFEKLSAAANIARGLAMDAVQACASSHLGLPLGAAEIGAVLYGELLRHDPADPAWINRDRFLLSAGHGSMFLYAWLHLCGYPLSLDEIKRFRQWGSKTPGHPEFGHTPGVEATTGPLGQGVGNAVGQAVAAKMMAARFNTAEHAIFDHTIWALAGDGCMQEGVASEAGAMAGHFKLDTLILIYDSNYVTLDAMAVKSQSEDTAKRFEAYGYEVLHLNKGNDLVEVYDVLARARASKSGKPRFVLAHTLIGKSIPEVAGTQKAHGEAGAKFVDQARRGLGLPEEKFWVPSEVKTFFAERREVLAATHAAWRETLAAWRAKNPDLSRQLDDANSLRVPDDLSAKIPSFASDAKLATRKASETVLQVVAAEVPYLMGASADLYGSTFNYIAASTDWDEARAMVGLDVIRPADPEETAGAWLAAIEHTGGPTVLALTRQAVPMLPGTPSAKGEGVLRGGYVLVQESAPLDTILIATGSEVQHAVAAARELGPSTRVVSFPCFSRFERQPPDYQESVLPSTCDRRVSVEAGVTFGWRTFVGTRGRMVGIDRYGASAPGNVVTEAFGMTQSAVGAAARAL